MDVSHRYVRNVRTGEVHRWLVGADKVYAPEECNKDQIEEAETLDMAAALSAVLARPERRCGHCWLGEIEEEA